MLQEIPKTSVFFFLDPQYDSVESTSILKPLKLERYGGSFLHVRQNGRG